mmetsp:Transcript_23257/g.34790  ORF Transcript_23257/g.34790 Transcript_23257/m.34790 type:complete len:315 (-) Transcript_23257:250-1194(-)
MYSNTGQFLASRSGPFQARPHPLVSALLLGFHSNMRRWHELARPRTAHLLDELTRRGEFLGIEVEFPSLVAGNHLVHCSRDRTIAERLQGKDRERLLDLDSDLLDAEKEEGDHVRCRHGCPMVPRAAHDRPESERQENGEDGQETSCVARVHERDGRFEDTLVSSSEINQRGNRRVNSRAVNGVQVGFTDVGRHGAQAEHGAVACSHARVRLRCIHHALVHQLVQLLPENLVVRRPTKKVAQSLRICGRVGGEATLESIVARVVREIGVRLTNNVAAAVDDATPERSRLVPPEVSCVGAEDKQQRKGRHRNSER